MGCSVVNITFSAGSLEGVHKYADLVYRNVTHIQGYHMADERIIETTQGPNGSYWLGMIQLTISDNDLNTSLVQLDAVEGGYVEGGDEVLELVFGDMRAEVIPLNEEDVGPPLLQMNQYLHNKVQEQSQTIAIMEMQIAKLIEQVAEVSATAKDAQRRCDGIQGYLLNYVDLPNMVKVVKRLAEEVDEDILNEHNEIVKVH